MGNNVGLYQSNLGIERRFQNRGQILQNLCGENISKVSAFLRGALVCHYSLGGGGAYSGEGAFFKCGRLLEEIQYSTFCSVAKFIEAVTFLELAAMQYSSVHLLTTPVVLSAPASSIMYSFVS